MPSSDGNGHPEPEPDNWALAIAKALQGLFHSHGKTPVVVYLDPDEPKISVIGKRQLITVKKKTGTK